jgi:hypothetical protein
MLKVIASLAVASLLAVLGKALLLMYVPLVIIVAKSLFNSFLTGTAHAGSGTGCRRIIVT